MSDLSTGLGYSHSIQESRYAIGLYASSKRKAGRGANDESEDARSVDNLLNDVLDIGNSRGITPGRETALSIVEEKAYAKIESSFAAEEVEGAETDDYWSPENTAGRIVGFALKFYDAYSQKNGESEETLDKFLSIVRGAIDEGIGEAEAIIGEASGDAVGPENASTISKTRDHIEKLLNAFRESALARLRGEVTDGSRDDESGAEEIEETERPEDERELLRVTDPIA
jgi:hypothetical protein